jgi:hypothetical protein
MLRALLVVLTVSGCATVGHGRDDHRRAACRAGFAVALEHARREPVYLDAREDCSDVLSEVEMATIDTLYTEWWRDAHTPPDRYRCPGSRGLMCGPSDGGTVVRVDRVESIAAASRDRFKPIDAAGMDVSCDPGSAARRVRVSYSWRRRAGGGASTVELACRSGQWQRVTPRSPLEGQPVL